MPFPPLIGRPVFFEPLPPVAAQCFQKTVAGEIGAADERHQRYLDQLGDERRNLGTAYASPEQISSAASRVKLPANTERRSKRRRWRGPRRS